MTATYSDNIQTNVETLEARARTIEQQEIDRSRAIDQKTAGLMAACLVVLGAGIVFATRLTELEAGGGARTLWAVLDVVAMTLALVGLVLCSMAIRPQVIHTAIHVTELEKWGTPRVLEREPTEVSGELLMASVDAVKEARIANKKKSGKLHLAFLAFAAALFAMLALGTAVAVHAAEETSRDGRRQARERPGHNVPGGAGGGCGSVADRRSRRPAVPDTTTRSRAPRERTK